MADPAAFDRPELAALWTELRRRFEATGDGEVRTVRLARLDPTERSALADLLGLARLPGEPATVTVARIDEAMRRGCGLGARELTERLHGPLRDRPAERAAAAAERAKLWADLDGHPLVTALPALRGWVDGLRRGGLIGGSVATTGEHCRAALAVLAELPAGGAPLPVLAQRVVGDPHALDEGTRLSNTVLRALAALHDELPPVDAAGRRDLWALHGVTGDELSTTVLVAGFVLTGSGVLATTLRAWAAAGQAVVVTLAQLRAARELPGMTRVHVVENPSVLAMAVHRFGPVCPPLVCTAGWPNTAAVTLLRGLRSAGAVLRYHGDFDGEGLRIAAYVLDRTGAAPWRMATADYLAAVTDHGPAPGRLTDAPWDPDLAAALAEHAVAVPEERVASALLDDLDEQCRYL
ncbi:MAG TPA: TIGR02679 family protein [Pseudonocardiaceae bacterium]|nr:TIGR02679 family protein [Pseudonocardiaceae bacterium]